MTDRLFEFAVLTKALNPEITSEQYDTLSRWNSLNKTTYIAVLAFNGDKTSENAVIATQELDPFLAFEDTVEACISDIFLILPDPEEAPNLFDYGRERKERLDNIKAITSIREIVQEAYTDAKLALETLQELNNNQVKDLHK
ncbi:hypothetical protein ACSLBF_17690 (plasmid) [Pseudoalteromonas sp. T1lg65]|uniref:hypothetical protein n=1 Tax=Pseudoalteromonas sp. T1lg65 TaxID=2077101 RepID=UPI003F7A7C6C